MSSAEHRGMAALHEGGEATRMTRTWIYPNLYHKGWASQRGSDPVAGEGLLGDTVEAMTSPQPQETQVVQIGDNIKSYVDNLSPTLNLSPPQPQPHPTPNMASACSPMRSRFMLAAVGRVTDVS